MIDTFYLHLEFKNEKSEWSINLPFLCAKCGACCLMEDFLTAGEITAKTEEQPEVHAKMKSLFEELGKMWETDEAKYNDYTEHTSCPFIVNNTCSIYEIRPMGCRLFPKTAFGMQTQDRPSLTRFRKQRSALIRSKAHKKNYYFVGSNKSEDSIKSTQFTKKQLGACIAKLLQVGITDEELNLFKYFNQKNKK